LLKKLSLRERVKVGPIKLFSARYVS